jgi:single-strand DNA-binding protein
MLNLAVVIGKLTKEPQTRSLPTGVPTTTFDLQVPVGERDNQTVPISQFPTPEGDVQSPSWPVGEQLVVVGRVRRRFFRAGGTTQSRTEIVAQYVAPLQDKDAVDAFLVQAERAIGSARELLWYNG